MLRGITNMKKAFIGLLILILSAWAQYVFSAEPIQLARMNGYVAAGVGAAASCSNGLTDTSYTEAADSAGVVTPTSMVGQSFEVSTPGMKIYSITILVYAAYGAITNETITIRYGTNPNLGGTCGVGNNCLKEVTTSALSLSYAETKTVEVIFQDTNALNTGTPYYFMVHSSASADFIVLYNRTGEYGNGVGYGTTSDASDWDLTGHNDDSWDLYFVIKKCN
jgi:hypothetical protein